MNGIKIRSMELFVGIFVFLGIVVLCYIVFSLGGLRFEQEGYPLNVLFGVTSGVDKGAPVRLAGIRIGEVKAVTIVPSKEENRTLIQLTLWINKKVQIVVDSRIAINSLGIFGEKYVEITPGSLTAQSIVPGQVVRGEDGILLDSIKDQIQRITTQFSEIANQLNNLLADREAMGNLKEAFKESKYLVADLRTMAQDADRMFVNANEKINYALGNKEAIDNLMAAFKNSKFLVEDFRTLAQNANDIVLKVKSGEGTVGSFIYKEEVYENIREFSRTLRYQPWKLLQKPRDEDSTKQSFGPDAASEKKGKK